MTLFNGDASEIYELAADLTAVGPKSVPAMRGVMQEVGDATAKQWSSSARDTFNADGHAKNYPDSIDAELRAGFTTISVEVGPNTALSNQAFLGRVLEFGGSHSPAYQHGLAALAVMTPRVERMVDSAMGHLFP